jgi:hypothetical protein
MITDFTQNDAGNLTKVEYVIDGSVVLTGSTSEEYEYTVVEGEHRIWAVATYEQGPVKKNNVGIDDPTGRIEAGSIKSNEIIFTGYHQVYAGGTQVPEVIDAAYLESLSSKILVHKKGVDYTFNVPTGAKFICLAIPQAAGTLTYLKQGSLMTDILSLFDVQEIIVPSISGDEPYEVYTLQLDSAFTNDDLIFKLS